MQRRAVSANRHKINQQFESLLQGKLYAPYSIVCKEEDYSIYTAGLRSGCVQTSHCAQGPEGELHFSFPHCKLFLHVKRWKRMGIVKVSNTKKPYNSLTQIDISIYWQSDSIISIDTCAEWPKKTTDFLFYKFYTNFHKKSHFTGVLWEGVTGVKRNHFNL